LLFEFRIGFTPEERQVLGHLHRPVARRERVNANVTDASLGSDLRVSVRPVYNSASLNLSDLYHVFAIAKVWQASLISFICLPWPVFLLTEAIFVFSKLRKHRRVA
jgi:hypothetical protein